MSKKIQKSVSILILSFGFPVFATTLLESTTAAGIANTIQGTGQVNPQQIINNVKNTVNQISNSQPASAQAGANPTENNPAQQVLGEVVGSPNNLLPQESTPGAYNNLNRALARDSLGQPVGKGGLTLENLRNLSKEEIIRLALSDGEIRPEDLSAGSVEYKSKAVVFYKKDCQSPAPESCQRSHPVFTNLKSVIFNYNHNRMNSQK